MTRLVCTGMLIVFLNVLVGCQSANSGRGQLVPQDPRQRLGPAGVVNFGDASEADIIEQMAVNRQAYRQGLELLIKYYQRAGNNMKLEWAQKELAGLASIIQYNYIVEAEAKSNLTAKTSILEADALYEEAFQIEKKAGPMPFMKDEKMLRLALNKYNQLISKHSSSDKIDDAAFRAGGIYEYFKDYTLAVLYYKRVYQWDRYTVLPAKYKAAYVLDRRLQQRAEALELYQQALKDEALAENYRDFAESRVMALTRSEEEM